VSRSAGMGAGSDVFWDVERVLVADQYSS
jgi:hypothetical protein